MKKDKKAGTTAECLADFFSRFGRSKILIEFAQVSPDTEGTWRNHRIMPEGITVLRVRCFLSQCGYEVSEFSETPKVIQEVALAVASNCVSLEKVVERLSMPSPHQFFSYFRGIQPSLERMKTFEEIANECRKPLEAKMSELQNRLAAEGIVQLKPAAAYNGHITSELIKEFADACEQVLKSGGMLLDGPRALRNEMRMCIGSGAEPLLHRAWEVLLKLLKETPTTPITTKGK